MNKKLLGIGIIFLFIVTIITPMTLGYNNTTSKKDTPGYCNFDRYLYPEYYDCYNVDEIPDFIEQQSSDTSIDSISRSSVVNNQIELAQPLDGPMDSPWPMYCHDTHHTGRSLYSTADNIGFEKWQFAMDGSALGSPVIDDQGIIYIGTREIYAIYPNGTLKWKYDIPYHIESAPAIDDNGVIYVGTVWDAINGDHLYALYPNGTLKWKYYVGDWISSSPVIGNDGTIYFGSESDYIYALYSNGTLKWKYLTGVAVFSSPAIGDDGTVYCGSHDDHVYALYPDNGTVKWSFNTGSWVHGSPTIGTDGTVYIGSDNGYLYAFYPNNGTVKWQCSIGYTWGSPAIDEYGTIYVGTWGMKFFAIYPNGTIKWTYDTPGRIWFGSSAAISAEGTIYFGTAWMDGGEGAFIALNSDGTERWKKSFGSIESSPAIGSDGTVYIGGKDDGYLYAFGKGNPNAPDKPSINGPRKGEINTNYTYTAVTTDLDGDNVSYYFDWGDGTNSGWTSYVPSGASVSLVHSWQKSGFFVIKVKAKDDYGKESDWGKLTVTMPKNKAANFNSLLLKLLERFPIFKEVLSRLIIG